MSFIIGVILGGGAGLVIGSGKLGAVLSYIALAYVTIKARIQGK